MTVTTPDTITSGGSYPVALSGEVARPDGTPIEKGLVAVEATAAATAGATSQIQQGNMLDDGIPGFSALSVLFGNGKAAGLRQDGYYEGKGTAVVAPTAVSDPDDRSLPMPIVASDLNFLPFMTMNPGDWSFDFEPGAYLIRRLSAKLNLGGTEYRGTGTVLSQYSSGALISATIKDAGWTGPVSQVRTGSYPTALAASVSHLAIFALLGQSQAGDSGAGDAAIVTANETTALYPHHAVMFSVGIDQDGLTAVDPTTLSDFVPAVHEVGRPAFAAVDIGVGYAAIQRITGSQERGALIRSDWRGSSSIYVFQKGTVAYANLIASLTRAALVAGQYGRDVEPHIVWMQGEASSSSYTTELRQLIADLQTDVFAAIGRMPKFMIVQTGGDDAGADISADTAIPQLTLAEENDGSPNVVLAATNYAYPIVDDYHLSNLGRKMLGEAIAAAAMIIEKRGTFRGVRPKTVVRTGASIVIDFWNDGCPLKWDTDWVLAAANYGFAYTGAAISSVAITGRDQVTITLASAAAGTLNYANTLIDTTDDVWSSARGQLFASAGIPSPAKLRGNAIPADVRFYCARFTKVL